jgi:hypothetical protein
MTDLGALEKKIVAFVGRRIAAMGVDGGGLYRYYSDLASEGRGFASYDVAVANFIVEKARGFETYIEAGPGLGQLVAILSAHGLKAIGVERDSKRFLAMRDLFAELPEAKEATAIEGEFPDAARELIKPSSLVIFTGFASGGSKADEDRLLAGAAPAGAIVMDLSRFCYLKHALSEREGLARQVEALGFFPPEEVLSYRADPPGQLVCFRRRAAN